MTTPHEKIFVTNRWEGFAALVPIVGTSLGCVELYR